MVRLNERLPKRYSIFRNTVKVVLSVARTKNKVVTKK